MSSSNSSSSSASGGIGCGGLLAVLLTVLFVGLKLTGYITWSWLWVISPILIYIGLSVLVLLVVLGVIIIGALGFGFAKGISNTIKTRKLDKERESRRFANARPISIIDVEPDRKKSEYKTGQRML